MAMLRNSKLLPENATGRTAVCELFLGVFLPVHETAASTTSEGLFMVEAD